MRMSAERQNRMRAAIHDSVREVRVKFYGKVPPKADFDIAQVGNEIWKRQKKILGL